MSSKLQNVEKLGKESSIEAIKLGVELWNLEKKDSKPEHEVDIQ